MGSVPVVMLDVLVEHPLEVTATVAATMLSTAANRQGADLNSGPVAALIEEVLFRVVPGSVVAQWRDSATVKLPRPRGAEGDSIAAKGHPAALNATLNAPAARPVGRSEPPRV